ncbi:bacteriohemerythrin [Sulfurimonas sp.]|uniref:bacteriohemerythrin n=1 Tax=Sulfurimonas sp. TaxID=2022749 RepID=UPI003564BC42
MVEWNEGLSLGVKSLDDDHKNLLNIINKLALAINNDEAQKFIDSIFEDLQNYAIDHFRREEELLKKCNCKKLDQHIKQHREFSSKIPELKANLSHSKDSSSAQEVSFFLTDWLFNHIIEEDIPAISMFEECGLTKEKKEKKHILSKLIKKTTDKFSFTRRILLSALTPLIGMLLFGIIILHNNFNKYEDMKKTSAITNIISNIDELVHALQIERGLSSGYLTSSQNKFKDNLQVQRTVVDMATKEFLYKVEITEIKNIKVIQPYINRFKTDISSIINLRKDIDEKIITQVRTIDMYTEIIKNILSITPKVAFLNLDREVSSSIATLSSIQHLKEALGQERAYGTMIIEQKDATQKEYITFTKLIGTQQAFLNTFEQTASGAQKHTNETIRNSVIAKLVNSYEKSIGIRRFDKLDTEVWFRSMTNFINDLKLFEDELLFDINLLIDRRINDTIINFLLWLSFTGTILIITLSILYTFKKSTKFQIYQLTNAMKDLATGGRSHRLSPIHINRDELAYMYDAYETTRQKLLKGDIYTQLYLSRKELEIKKHQKENIKLEELAFIDPLTGTLNRRKFEELSNLELERSKRYKSDLSFLMLDIDHFKIINDTYGHAIGDDILKHFSSICLDMARSLDIVARIGGEEFIIMLPETTSEGAYIFAERFREKIYSCEVELEGQVIKYSVSIGIAVLDKDKEVKEILQKADKALYKAKESGRNCTIVYK